MNAENISKDVIMKAKTDKSVEEMFTNPTAKYRGIPFWSWNCKVTKEMIDTQLEIFKRMGFGGVDIHPRAGLDITYLGEEYMEMVAYTVKRCKELGLVCWLYDEDRFPSGAAGGIVTKNFRFRGRYLLLTERKRLLSEGYYESREAFEEAIDKGEKPAGYYVTTYGLVFENGYLRDYSRLDNEAEISKARENNEKIRFAYVEIMKEEAWFQNQTYVDTMNPDAIDEFIKVTHEEYHRYVGDEFGETVPAIFTDEPRMGKNIQISNALSGEDVTLPYTDYFAETMIEEYGTDPLDIAPEYIWELADGRFSVNRYNYHNHAAECFVTVYMDKLCKWCEEHNIAMTGHVLSEETLGSQTYALGDCMRCYRNMDIPGIDILADRREYATAKQAVSVARQNGITDVVSELYGVTHWDCDFKTFKLQGDWQAALGITVRVPHLSHMSLLGEAKRDWPGSIFFHAPWHEEYTYIEDYFARLNSILTRGKVDVNIGVIHPVESFWMYMGPDNQTADKRKEMDEDHAKLISWLIHGAFDFDFLSESLLPKQCENYKDESENRLTVGKMQYSAILVPNMLTIRKTTLDILEAFAEKGGKIVFMGRVPELVDGLKTDRVRKLAEKCLFIGKDRNELYEAFESERTVDICRRNGSRTNNLIYQMRKDENLKWLFICHTERKKQHMSDMEKYIIKVRGSYQVSMFDAQTGEIYPVVSRLESGNTIVECNIYAEDSVLYRLEECADETATCYENHSKAVSRFETVEYITKINGFHREEYNAVLLDYAICSVDDGELSAREEILRLDNRIRKQLGFVLRGDRMNQPYYLEEKDTYEVSLMYHFESETEVAAFLAIENPDNKLRIWLNGNEIDSNPVGYYVDPAIKVLSLPTLKIGINELNVKVEYNQKTNLENIFILGDFDVELRGNYPIIKPTQNKLYLGDIVGQGMPFYTGNLEYEFEFNIEDETAEYYVHVPHFKAPLLAVSVDEGERKLIAYAPHRAKLGRLKTGKHYLKICLYGNRFNGFGTLHNANDDYVWYGPDSFRTKGDDWTDSYRVRPVGIMSAIEIQKQL